MQAERPSMALSSEASYCDPETWEDWGSRTSLSHDEHQIPSHPSSDEVAQLRAERDSLAGALMAARRAAAAAARAHDARLAELHGVIAELVRRRAADKSANAIAEVCESQDECESTTQPAGELSNDADRSRTDQGDTSGDITPEGTTDLAKEDTQSSLDINAVLDSSLTSGGEADTATDKYAETDVDARCCDSSRRSASVSEAGSCERDRGSNEDFNAAGHYEARHAKLAYRVRLKRTDDDERETEDLESRARLLQRCRRLEAELQDLEYACAAARDNLHSAWLAQTAQRARGEALCRALRAADRALELHDVLLALAETEGGTKERASAQSVAAQVLARLAAPAGEEPLLSPGPWMTHRTLPNVDPWSDTMEPTLRAHCARLKALSAELRPRDMSEIEIVTATESVGHHFDSCHKKSGSRRHRSAKARAKHWLEPASETDL